MRTCLENRTAVSSTARAPSSEGLETALDTAHPHFESNEVGCLEENMNLNTSELPRLAVEPLQMKKKRKGGALNLRKSLAWDKAFFTEEGVLDLQELSVISGPSCTKGWPCNNERTRGTPQQLKKPIDKQKLNTNVSRKLQGGELAKDTKKDRFYSSSSGMFPSSSLTSHRASIPVGCKSESRFHDFPQPLSSLKRPAKVNDGNDAGKELKLLKSVGSNPGLSPICTSTKATIPRLSCMKHSQHIQPGLNSSNKSLKHTQNALESLQPTHYSYGNIGNSSFRKHSAIDATPCPVEKANNSSSKIISDTMKPFRPVHASEAPFSRTMHHLSNQGMKPSGLRMPSPSLSFFSEFKPSRLCGLARRGAGVGVCSVQESESCKLNENLSRTPGVDNNTPPTTISCKAMSSSSVCMASSQVSAPSTKSTKEHAPQQKVQDCSKNNIIVERISQNETEIQSINVEALLKSGNQEKVKNVKLFTNSLGVYPVKDELKNPEQQSEQKCAIQETKVTSATDEFSEDKRKHGTMIRMQCKDSLDHREQKSSTIPCDWEHYCELDKGNFEIARYSLGDTDTATTFLQSQGSEKLAVAQYNGEWCSSQCSSTEPLEHRQDTCENSYFGPENLLTDLSDECVVTDVLTDNLHAGQPAILNVACDSNIGDCVNDTVDGSKQLGKCTMVKNICPEGRIELQKNIELNTGERLPEKQIHIPKRLQEQNIENTMFVVQDGNNGSKVLDSKTARLSPCKVCDCNFDEDKIIGQSLSSTIIESDDNALSLPSSLSPCKASDCNSDEDEITEQNLPSTISESIENSMSLERSNNVISNAFSSDEKQEGGNNHMPHNSADQNLSSSLCYSWQSTEIDCSSSSPLSRTHEMSEQNSFGKTELILQDGSVKNKQALRASLKENEPDIDNPVNKDGDDLKEKGCSSVFPPNAIPFSDEWFSTIEAAGEDILTKKSGAVQNSPPDKNLPEPSPWSPVKKKHNQIGPYDCTKYTSTSSL